MINSDDVIITKDLVIFSLFQACNICDYFKTKSIVEKAFGIVIREMKEGKI